MSDPDDGGPAFPVLRENNNPDMPLFMASAGMSLRDWFAGLETIDPSEDYGWPLLEALAGPRPEGNWQTNPLGWFDWANRWQAKVRYARADAMLAARYGGAQ